MSKYAKLGETMNSVPAAEVEIVLSFGQMEEILASPLPKTAKIDRKWWANTHRSNHATHWLNTGWVVGSVDFGHGLVRFIRQGDSARKSKASYGQLRAFLQAIPEKQRQLVLTFTELSNTIGHSLPRTALHDPTWWANTRQSSPQGSAWLSTGWEVEKAYLKAQIVVFRRTGTDPVRAIPKFVNSLLQHSSVLRRPSAQVLQEWIRFCRRVGWYFQAVVLYERGGLSMDCLSETDREEVEEDYGVCKRSLFLHKNVEISAD
jgi:hypothetical protein